MHTSDDLKLLVVLLPKIRPRGLRQVQENGHDGGYGPQMTGSRSAFPSLGQIADLDRGVESEWIDRHGLGRKDEVGSRLPSELDVALEIPWVASKVFGAGELRWVDKDADNGQRVLAGRSRDQRKVSRMQRAHRWHETGSRVAKHFP